MQVLGAGLVGGDERQVDRGLLALAQLLLGGFSAASLSRCIAIASA
jgi:hypothetical protein